MTHGLRRFHQSRQAHFLTFSCYHRQPKFNSREVCDLFLDCLEAMRLRFAMRIYGYVIMPEHVHLLVSEPDQGTIADAMHFLKLSFAKRLKATVPQVRGRPLAANLGQGHTDQTPPTPFWQKSMTATYATRTSSQ